MGRTIKTLKGAKRKAWKCFSKYIRARDCYLTTNTLTRCKCVTCRKEFPLKEIQAGHAIGGRNNSILFDEKLVNGQCKGCNGFGNGKYAEYSVWFIETYGLKEWEEKVILSKQSKKYSIHDCLEIAEDYESKYKVFNLSV